MFDLNLTQSSPEHVLLLQRKVVCGANLVLLTQQMRHSETISCTTDNIRESLTLFCVSAMSSELREENEAVAVRVVWRESD